MQPSLTFKNGTHIEWNYGDDGGGSTHYVDFLNALGTGKKYDNCLEWCAGLSAVAFSLLDAGIAENFVLMDLYEPALLQAQNNARENNISNRIDIRVCDKIASLPSTDKFNLVVSNPPHVETDYWILESPGNHIESIDLIKRLTVDKDWECHKEFFRNIINYLNPNADIYISETVVRDYMLDWAKEAGLNLINVFPANELAKDTKTDAVILHFRYEK